MTKGRVSPFSASAHTINKKNRFSFSHSGKGKKLGVSNNGSAENNVLGAES